MNLAQSSLQHFYYFHVVATQGSIKTAARVLHLTQPAVSLRIKSLEASLDTQLFDRDFRRLKLTPAGQSLLEFTGPIFALAEKAVNSLSPSKTAAKVLKIGFVPSVSINRVHKVIEPMWKSGLILQVSQGAYSELHEQMKIGQLDVMIVDTEPRLRSDWTVKEVAQRRLIFVAAPKYKSLKANFPKSLEGTPFISFTEKNALCFQVERFFALNKVKPQIVGKIDDITLLGSFLIGGRAVGILSVAAAQPYIESRQLIEIGHMSNVISRLWIVSRV